MNKVVALFPKRHGTTLLGFTSPSFLKTSAVMFSRRPPGRTHKLESPMAKVTKLLDGETSQGSKKDDASKTESVSRRLNADSKAIGKLRMGLLAKKKGILDNASQGRLETTCEDVMDNMNETLASSALINVFKGVKDASMVIEIAHVEINMDYSHATAHWESEILMNFVDSVRTENGPEDALKLALKMETKITAKLQKLEPLFRTRIVKQMDFRRVPRIYFKCVDPTFETLYDTKPPESTLKGASVLNLLRTETMQIEGEEEEEEDEGEDEGEDKEVKERIDDFRESTRS
jgi:ribosome-binding factor A